MIPNLEQICRTLWRGRGRHVLSLFVAVLVVTAGTPWTVEQYRQLGISNPAEFWSVKDFRRCRDVIQELNWTNRLAIPQLGDPISRAYFDRLVNSTNTDLLPNRYLQSPERIRQFVGVMGVMEDLQRIYRPDHRKPDFLRESLEVDLAYLRMLRSAVEYNGQILPLAPGETEGTILKVGQPRDSRAEIPSLGERVPVVAFRSMTTFESILSVLVRPHLAESDRMDAVRRLHRDLPVLWPQLIPKHQQEALVQLEFAQSRLPMGPVKDALKKLRDRLSMP